MLIQNNYILLLNRDLQEEVRISRRKVERQRQSESNWQTLLVNPSRFSQVNIKHN